MAARILEKPQEGPARSGFFEAEQFEAVRRRLRPDLQVAVTIGYVFGWRKGEVLGLERRHVDLDAGTLRLDPGTTKNDEGRVVYLTPEVARLLGEQLDRVDTLQKQLGRIIPFVFPHLAPSGRGDAGRASRASTRPGPRPARRRACPGASSTICGAPPSATWSAQPSRGRWRPS